MVEGTKAERCGGEHGRDTTGDKKASAREDDVGEILNPNPGQDC